MKKNILELELFISKFLRFGVFVSAFFILIGWFGQIDWHNNKFDDFKEYHHTPLLNALNTLISSQSWGSLLIYLGLLILILLPLFRVFFTGLIFIKQKEYAMASLVGLVMLGLIVSISFGFEI